MSDVQLGLLVGGVVVLVLSHSALAWAVWSLRSKVADEREAYLLDEIEERDARLAAKEAARSREEKAYGSLLDYYEREATAGRVADPRSRRRLLYESGRGDAAPPAPPA